MSPERTAEIASANFLEIVKHLNFEFYYPSVPAMSAMSFYNGHEIGVATLVGVIDDSMTDEQQDSFIG